MGDNVGLTCGEVGVSDGLKLGLADSIVLNKRGRALVDQMHAKRKITC